MRESILRYLSEYYREVGVPPTVQQIADHVGLSSKSTVHSHIRILERDGRIRNLGSRGILVVSEPG